MKHDPFYGKIIERLNGRLDPDTFEACVIDLLRTQDGLFAVPILGGSDSGMDGAVADFEGEPYPVVITTAKNVIGNMTKNLDKYKEDGIARTCIVATSRSLTPRKQKNLTNKARELDFTLLQIVEQSGIAARLYHDSKWCKELLQLTGKPSALSIIPETRRPLPESELIGRTEARDWLRNSHGDRLLVGDPGAGKTSLLCEWAVDGKSDALFLVDYDLDKVAIAVRDQQPKVIIVDDAHTDIMILTKLLRLRQEISGDFDIIATSWKGDGPEIAQMLSARPENVHELTRLARDEIAEIIITMGISRDHWLVDEIVRQSGGLPGLAGTLTYFALQGRWREIYTGDALATDITRFYKNRITGDVAGLLACFAIGGKAGMAKGSVSTALNMPTLQLRQDLSNLAHGGIIAEVPYRTDFIKVRPPALRHALIRDIFFSGPSALPESVLQGLLAAVPEHVDTVRDLIDVTRRWGDVPQSLIQTPLEKFIEEASRWLSILPSSPLGHSTPTLEAVREYAQLGPKQANWVMDNFTASLSHIARPLLENVPERVIPLLLSEAVGDTRSLHSNTEHPLRLLQDWIKQTHPDTEEPVQRRIGILHIAKSWLSDGHDPAIGYSAMLLAVIPTFEFTRNQPGGNGIRIFSGFLNQEHLLKLQEFWHEIVDFMRVVEPTDWNEHLASVEQWAFPMDCPSDEIQLILTEFGKKMALDIKEADAPIGVLYRLRRLMERFYPDLEIFKDDVIDTLYPANSLDIEWKQQTDSWLHAIDALADKWKEFQPDEVIKQLISIELEVNQEWPRLTPDLCSRLATKTLVPLLWFDLMLPTTLPADTVMPFLQEAIRRESTGWEQRLRSSFDTERLRGRAFQIILTHPQVSDDLKQAAWNISGQYIGGLQQLLWSDQLSSETIIELFAHPEKSLVAMLAVEVWQRNKGNVAHDIRPLWEQAIIECCKGDYWLREIFKVEAELAVRWFGRQFVNDSYDPPYEFYSDLGNVFAEWSLDARRKLLHIAPDGYSYNGLIVAIVGDSLALYKLLFQQSNRTQSTLLSPLHRSIGPVWIAFAKLAHEHGHAPKEIVTHTFMAVGITASWVGEYSNVWKTWRDQFDAIRNYEDAIIRQIAEIGYQRSNEQYEAELAKERDEDVYGRE